LVSFRAGKYCTKFIPEEYPQGFRGVNLSRSEYIRFVAGAYAIHIERLFGCRTDPKPFEDDTGDKHHYILVVSDNNGTLNSNVRRFRVSTELGVQHTIIIADEADGVVCVLP